MKRFLSMLLLSLMLAFQVAAVAPQAASTTYVLNTNTKKFHRPQCSSVNQMKEKNRQNTTMSYDEIIEKGYVPCKNCNPSRADSSSGAKSEEAPAKVQEAPLKTSVQSVVQNAVTRTVETTYVVNTNTRKFHYPSCSSVGDMKEKNRLDSTKSRDELVNEGYVPCKRCKP